MPQAVEGHGEAAVLDAIVEAKGVHGGAESRADAVDAAARDRAREQQRTGLPAATRAASIGAMLSGMLTVSRVTRDLIDDADHAGVEIHMPAAHGLRLAPAHAREQTQQHDVAQKRIVLGQHHSSRASASDLRR